MHHRKNSSCPARPTRARTPAKRSTARARALQDPRGVVNLARWTNYIFCMWWHCLITNMRCWLQSWNGYRAQDAILVVNTGPSPCRPGTFNNEASEVGMIKLSRTNWAITNHLFQRWHHATIPQAGDCLQCWCSGRTDVCQSADLKLTIAPPPQVTLVLAKWLCRHQFQRWLGWPPTCRACSSLWRCLAGQEQLLDRLMPTISSSLCLPDRGSR